MAKKKFTKVVKKQDGSGYDYVYLINGKQYSSEEIRTYDTVENNMRTRTVFDVNTGEILAEYTSNVISENNSKVFTHANGFEIAKDKNVPREKVLSGDKHIIDLCKEHSEYLQTSTGSKHDRRGIITVDMDLQLPENDMSKEQVYEHVNSVIHEKITFLKDLKIPLPSVYQIHLTNGHVQMHWVLDEEVQIKKIVSRTVNDNGNSRKLFFFENTRNWVPYMQCMRFLAILLDGDRNFTGWQIKNMFLSDETFKDDFTTMWLYNGTYTDIEPVSVFKYDFKRIHSCIYSFLNGTDDTKTELLKSLISDTGCESLTNVINGELCLSNNMKAVCGIKKEYKRPDIKEGRNQFVRMKTYEVIRVYKNKIEIGACHRIVKKAFENALKEDGTLPGTKNRGFYSKQDFERDFTGAYYHAITTYNKPLGYTQEQRERSIRQRKSIKNKRHEILLTILEKHPELIPGTKQNCIALRKLIHEADNSIIIKSNNTISNYKKELGIKTGQKRITVKNYKKAERLSYQRISRLNDLNMIYNANKHHMSEKSLKEWEKRINDISIKDSYKRLNDQNIYKSKSNSLNDINYLKNQSLYKFSNPLNTLEKNKVLKI